MKTHWFSHGKYHFDCPMFAGYGHYKGTF